MYRSNGNTEGHIHSYMTSVSAQGVGVMEDATFLQVAVVVMGSQLQLKLADSHQVIEEEVTVMNFKRQYVVLLSIEGGELLLPPGVDFVVTDGCSAQGSCAAVRLDIRVCDSQQVSGKISGTQVIHPELGLSHTQTA